MSFITDFLDRGKDLISNVQETGSTLIDKGEEFFTEDIPDFFGTGDDREVTTAVTSTADEVDVSTIDRDAPFDVNSKLAGVPIVAIAAGGALLIAFLVLRK